MNGIVDSFNGNYPYYYSYYYYYYMPIIHNTCPIRSSHFFPHRIPEIGPLLRDQAVTKWGCFAVDSYTFWGVS